MIDYLAIAILAVAVGWFVVLALVIAVIVHSGGYHA